MLCASAVAASACQKRDSEALERSSTYLAARAEIGDARRLLLVPYLSRKYERVATRRAFAPHAERYCETLSSAGLQPFCRFVSPDAGTTLAAIEALRSATDVLVARALHCGALSLDGAFEQRLELASQASGYTLTHAALATLVAAENGCLDETRQLELSDVQAPRLLETIRNEGADTDLGLEALVLLLATRGAEGVEAKWIDAGRRAQNVDGGWGQKPGEQSWDHTSVLGYWLLLEST
jgi:hypothetical protein